MSKMVDETWLAWIEGGFEKRMEKIRNVAYIAECPGRSHSTWEDAISRCWTSYFASPCPIFPICRMQVIIRTSVAFEKCGHKLFGTPSIQRKVSVPSIWLRAGYNCSNPQNTVEAMPPRLGIQSDPVSALLTGTLALGIQSCHIRSSRTWGCHVVRIPKLREDITWV